LSLIYRQYYNKNTSPENPDPQPLSELEIERLKMMELSNKMRENLPIQEEVQYEDIALRGLHNQE